MDDGCALNMIRGRVSWLGERIPAKPGETGRGEGSPSSGGSTRVELCDRAQLVSTGVDITWSHAQYLYTTVFRLTVSVVACVRFC